MRAVILAHPLQGLELDLCTPAPPELVAARAQAAGLSLGTQGAPWGCLTLEGFEVTSFRAERYSAGSRHPQVRFGVDLQTDAARRDFSCNAVYLKPNGTLIDPYGGVEHLKAGRVVWVEEPIRKLTEDPIRWWRWVRFCGLYGVTSVVAPTWVGADGREQVCTLEPLAQAVMAAKRAVSASRWAAERKHADTVRGAQAVRTALQQGLAAHPAWQEELTP